MQWGEDRRFDNMRNNLGKLAVFWIFQVPFSASVLLLDVCMSISRNPHQAISFIFFLTIEQAVWVWTVSLPVTVVNASDRNPSIEARDIIGWIMWLIGICVEAAADQQKLMFKNNPSNRGKWCDAGLWKYSRHPNYFGEVGLFSLVFWL